MHNDIFTSQRTRNSILKLLSSTKKRSDFQRVQCIWLRIEFNMKADEIGRITNLKPSTVRKIWSKFSHKGVESLLSKEKGGRRNYYLSQEEERMFLSPFFRKADRSGTMEVTEIKRSYENLIGKEVPKSTIYRLLARHGWQRKRSYTAPHATKEAKEQTMQKYWIEGCSQALNPTRTGNIAQQWLNATLNSMQEHSQLDQISP